MYIANSVNKYVEQCISLLESEIIKELLLFCSHEKVFKCIYENALKNDEIVNLLYENNEATYVVKDCIEDRCLNRHLICEIQKGTLEDDIFFLRTNDISINIHPRYLPEYFHKHQFIELQYVLAGELYQNINGKDIKLNQGGICFIAPDTEHMLSVYDDSTLVVNILIKKDILKTLFVAILNTRNIISDFFTRILYKNKFYPFMFNNSGVDCHIHKVILEMINISVNNYRQKNILIRNKLEEIFIYLLEKDEYCFNISSVVGEAEKNMQPVIRYIRENYKSVTLSELAYFFNYSESYLSRKIKSYTGNNFTNILKTIKIQQAANLLKESPLPVSEICIEVGYEDQSQFYRSFKEYFKMTPAEYKKSIYQK